MSGELSMFECTNIHFNNFMFLWQFYQLIVINHDIKCIIARNVFYVNFAIL